MTALTEDKKVQYKEGVDIPIPVASGETIYAGGFVCVNADGYALPGADTSNLIFVGVAREYVDNSGGSDGDENVTVRRRGVFKATMGNSVTQANVGDSVFLSDDQTLDLTADVSNNIYAGIIAGYIDSTHVWVDIEPAVRQADVATHIADSSGAHAASAISITDSGTFTSKSDVEAALQEIYQHITTAKGIIDISMPTILNDGTALAQFSNGASATPGYCTTAEGMGIRWNNHATPTPVATKVMVPPDMNAESDAVVNILAAKVGATAGDATKFTIQAFNNDVGELYDADADFGGDTDAMTGDATSKTVQHVSLTLANADLIAYPAAIELTIQPKDGTIETDDVILLKAWIEYQRKILTS
jgi:hypothetical protein